MSFPGINGRLRPPRIPVEIPVEIPIEAATTAVASLWIVPDRF